MKQYRGYYIDGVIFNNEAEIDEVRKQNAINYFINAVQAFEHNRTTEAALFVDEQAENLVNNFGLTWEEVEAIEIQTIAA